MRRLPFRVLVVQTDNGAEFQSKFRWHLEDLDVRHVYIRPRTPRLNGKVERSHRIDHEEFYQLLEDGPVRESIYLFNRKLRQWEDYYNFDRPHGALFVAGFVVAAGGLVGMIAAGGVLAHRNRKRYRLPEVDYRAPHRVQWDLARSRLVF